MNVMHTVSSSLKVLEKIIRHMSKWERLTVLILTAVILAALGRLALPALLEIPQTLGSAVYGEGLIGNYKTLNPLFADFNEADRDIGRLVFSGLLKYSPKEKNFIPDLAAEIKRSKDDLTYIVALKKNIFWHDGEPVTADDVVFTFQKIVQDAGFKNLILKSAFKDVKIQKIDNETVSFTLKNKNSYFPSYLTTGLLPAHILKEAEVSNLDKNIFNKRPIGTGPYQIASGSDLNSSILLRKFENFYGKEPFFDFVRFSFYKTPEDIVSNKNKFNVIPKISDSALKDRIQNGKRIIMNYSLAEYVAAFFNLERPWVSKKKIRQALMKSVDKNRIPDLIRSVLVIDTLGLKRAESEWINEYDPTAVEDIFKNLGYKKDGNGFWRDSKNQVLTLAFLTERFPNNPVVEQKTAVLADFLKNSWQNQGIKIELRREEGRNFAESVSEREYDIILTGVRLGYNTDIFTFWHSSQKRGPGLNFSQLSSFRIDSLLEDLRFTFDSKKKSKKLAEIEKLISEETPALFLYKPEYYIAIDKGIGGFYLENMAYASDRFGDFENVTMKKTD